MIRKLTIILAASAFLFSCQQDELDENASANATDAVPVKFTMSLETGLENEVGYEPMGNDLRAADESLYRVKISNGYRAIISKHIGSKWILEKYLINPINPGGVWDPGPELTNGTNLANFTTELTPGDYRITIITGGNSIGWNTITLVKGALVDDDNDPDFKVPMACAYARIPPSYTFAGFHGLEEEIFSGYKDFEVKKTNDLHSLPLDTAVNLTLNRMVTKLRIALDNTPATPSSYKFPTSFNNTISANISIDDPAGFATGLDAWGNPYYNPNEIISDLKHVVSTGRDIITVNGRPYLLPYIEGQRQYDAYYWGDPAKDYNVTVSDVSVTYQSGSSKFWTDEEVKMTLKNNHISGFILQLGDEESSEQVVQPGGGVSTVESKRVHVQFDSGSTTPTDPSEMFDYNIEYRQ